MDEHARRKYQTSRRTYGGGRKTAGQGTDLREKILTQCILSGIVLIIALLLSLIDTGFTNGIRNGVKTVLSGDVSLESLAGGFSGISESYAGMRDSLNMIFGGPDEESYAVAGAYYGDDEELTAPDAEDNASAVNTGAEFANDQTAGDEAAGADGAPAVGGQDMAAADEPAEDVLADTAGSFIDEDFRIDEDILAQINSRVDFYNTRTARQ